MCCSHILEYRRHFITFYYVDNFNIDLFDLSNCTFYYTIFSSHMLFFIVCLVYFLLHTYNMYFMTHLTISISCITICILHIIVFVLSSPSSFFCLHISSLLISCYTPIFPLFSTFYMNGTLSILFHSKIIIYYIFFLFFTPILNSILSDKQQKIFIRRRSFSMRV